MEGSVTDLHDPAESGQGLLIDLLTPKQLGIVEEVAEEPAQLPKSFCGAIDAAGNDASGQFSRLED
jgi:hypothetical protein